jgi:hypothetical protein
MKRRLIIMATAMLVGCSQHSQTAFDERLFDKAVAGCEDGTPRVTDKGIQQCVN